MGMRGLAVAVGLGGLLVVVAGLVVGSSELVRQGTVGALAAVAGYAAFTPGVTPWVRWPLAAGLAVVAVSVALTRTPPLAVYPARPVPLLVYAALVLAVAALPVRRRRGFAVGAPVAGALLLGYVAVLYRMYDITPTHAVRTTAVPLGLTVLALAGAALATQRAPMPPVLAGMLLLAVPPLLTLRAASYVFGSDRALGAYLVAGTVYRAEPTPAAHGPVFPVPGSGVVALVAWLTGLVLLVAGCVIPPGRRAAYARPSSP